MYYKAADCLCSSYHTFRPNGVSSSDLSLLDSAGRSNHFGPVALLALDCPEAEGGETSDSYGQRETTIADLLLQY